LLSRCIRAVPQQFVSGFVSSGDESHATKHPWPARILRRKELNFYE
jgi:hypothetical protein